MEQLGASLYLVLKLEGMNLQYCTGFENARARVCVVGSRVKNWYFSLKDSEGGGISEIKIQKKNNNKKKKKKKKKQSIQK